MLMKFDMWVMYVGYVGRKVN